MTVVAVTGASGFLGLHVVAALAARRVPLVATSRKGVRPQRSPEGVRWLSLDLGRDPADAYERLGRPGAVVHLAWEGLPNYCSARHVDVELPRQTAFLQALVEDGLPSLVVAGTCLEYGMQTQALSETTVPQPATPYAVAKDRLRRDLEDLQRTHGFALTWARLFYMYGDGQAPTSLYSQFCRAVDTGQPCFDMSGGEQVRDYLPVTTVAAYLADLAVLDHGAGILNVCSARPVTVRALVEGWQRERHSTIALHFGRHRYPDHEPMAFWGDASKLRALLGGGGDDR